MRYRRHLDDAERGELVAAYQAGATVHVLAERFGVHRDTVARYVKNAGIETRYHEPRQIDLARADELRSVGLTLTEIAERQQGEEDNPGGRRRRCRGG